MPSLSSRPSRSWLLSSAAWAAASSFRDVRYGLRSIRRTAPLSAAVVVTLAVGVGMTSVVFSLVNGLLFRPAVTRDPASFVAIYPILSGVSGGSGTSFREVHGPDWLATR